MQDSSPGQLRSPPRERARCPLLKVYWPRGGSAGVDHAALDARVFRSRHRGYCARGMGATAAGLRARRAAGRRGQAASRSRLRRMPSNESHRRLDGLFAGRLALPDEADDRLAGADGEHDHELLGLALPAEERPRAEARRRRRHDHASRSGRRRRSASGRAIPFRRRTARSGGPACTRAWSAGSTRRRARCASTSSIRSARPHSIINDASGNIWYTGNGNGTVGKLDPATGKITAYPMPDPNARDPHTPIFNRPAISGSRCKTATCSAASSPRAARSSS